MECSWYRRGWRWWKSFIRRRPWGPLLGEETCRPLLVVVWHGLSSLWVSSDLKSVCGKCGGLSFFHDRIPFILFFVFSWRLWSKTEFGLDIYPGFRSLSMDTNNCAFEVYRFSWKVSSFCLRTIYRPIQWPKCRHNVFSDKARGTTAVRNNSASTRKSQNKGTTEKQLTRFRPLPTTYVTITFKKGKQWSPDSLRANSF